MKSEKNVAKNNKRKSPDFLNKNVPNSLVDQINEELQKKFGLSVIDLDNNISRTISNALDKINSSTKNFKFESRFINKLIESNVSEFRTFAARVTDTNNLHKLSEDTNRSVLIEVAKRCDFDLLKKIKRAHRNDEGIQYVAKRRLQEEKEVAGAKKSEVFDIKNLPESWYEDLAYKLMNTYGKFIDTDWEEKVVKNYVNSLHSVGACSFEDAKLVGEKLYKKIKDCMEEKDDLALAKLESKKFEKKKLIQEAALKNTIAFPILVESVNVSKTLVETKCSGYEYIQRFNIAFNVKFSEPSRAIYEHCELNGTAVDQLPKTCYSPGGELQYNDEIALDRYIECYNSYLKSNGIQCLLEWNSPDSKRIIFKARLN